MLPQPDPVTTSWTVALKAREEIAQGTLALRFDKPAGFRFKPGQAIDLTLLNPSETDAKGARRAFSLVSAPSESELTVATRLRDSAFKRTLTTATMGTRFQLDGPFGSLLLHSTRSRPAIFIAGGIGITPFISILRQATTDRLPQNLFLFYANRRPEEAAFLPELSELEKRNGHFRLFATMTQMHNAHRGWTGPTGRITWASINAIAGQLSMPIYYVVGPPAMVAATREMLNAAGVNDDDIRSEDFSGY
ncbi:MAG TPA: FAD-dependent oxidoreductase [Nevskiaceae bacterium]|nr:FAD-dependent oxidoreductase [Nevskiaceae bacterium]